MSTITINGTTIDLKAPKAELAAHSLHNLTAKNSDYIIVQTRGPLDKSQRTQLANAGAKILEAVPENGFVCHYPKISLEKLRSLPFVKWADVYPTVVKIAPTLRDLEPKPGGISLVTAAAKVPAKLDATRVTVDVVLHRNANLKLAAKHIAAAAHRSIEEIQIAGEKVRLTLKVRRLADIAALDEVRHIEKVYARKLANNVARQILGVPNSAQSASLSGKGEIVAVADTGFDRGSTSDVHPAFTGRVKKLYALGRKGRTDDPDGHGTHVAGSVLGDGQSKSDGPVQGTAPGAKLVLQSVLDVDGGLGGLPNDLRGLFRSPYTDGARVHSNSWGSVENFAVYDQQAFEVDDFVYKNRDMLICFAAGNDGKDSDGNGRIDPKSVTPPGTAKNCLTVGASENKRPSISETYGAGWPDDFPANPIKSDKLADNPEGMVAFSSRGPTNNERIKPDVVAPGTYILSTRSRATKSEGWGVSADPLYMFDGGTSMATPLVAGCVAVIREFLRKKHKKPSPSAALLKALIINGAHDLAGQYVPTEAGTTPNSSEGFGRVDVAAIIGPYGSHGTIQFVDESVKLDTGERRDITVPIPAGVQQLKVTLVWTDPPGEGLQNDLDLVVRIGAQKRHGNMPQHSSDFDRKNNVEQISWDGLPTGQAIVSVVAHAISLKPQDYALVIRTV